MAALDVDSTALLTAAGILGGAIAAAARMISKAIDRSTEVMLEVKELLGRVDASTSFVHGEIVAERSGVQQAPTFETTTEHHDRQLSAAEKAVGYGRPDTPSRGVRAKTEPGGRR